MASPVSYRNVRCSTVSTSPFWQGPRLSKADIRAITRPGSGTRTRLSTKLWIETSLSSLPRHHKARDSLVGLLYEYGVSCRSRSSSQDEGYVSASPTPSTPRKKRTRFPDLPEYIRQKVYKEVLSSVEPEDSLTSTTECHRLQTLVDIHPILRVEIDQACKAATPIPPEGPSLASLNTSFRINGSWSIFNDWYKTIRQEGLTGLHEINVLLWSWHWLDGDEQDWTRTPDIVTVSVDEHGLIDLRRKGVMTQSPHLCACSPANLVRYNGLAQNWNTTEVRDMLAFVRALRTGQESPLVASLDVLAKLVQVHDRELKRDSVLVRIPKLCRYCRRRRVYLTSHAS